MAKRNVYTLYRLEHKGGYIMKKKEVGTRVRVTRGDSEWLDFEGVITSINEKNRIASINQFV